MPRLQQTPDVTSPDAQYLWTVIMSTYAYVFAFVPGIGPSFVPRFAAIAFAAFIFLSHIYEAIIAIRITRNADSVKPVHVFYWGLQTWMWGFPSLLKLKEVTKEEVEALKQKKEE